MEVDLDELACPLCGSPDVTIAIEKTTEAYKITTIYCTHEPHVWRCEID